jgi:hypothetical protein
MIFQKIILDLFEQLAKHDQVSLLLLEIEAVNNVVFLTLQIARKQYLDFNFKRVSILCSIGFQLLDYVNTLALSVFLK